jgi:hypothetical protein
MIVSREIGHLQLLIVKLENAARQSLNSPGSASGTRIHANTP